MQGATRLLLAHASSGPRTSRLDRDLSHHSAFGLVSRVLEVLMATCGLAQPGEAASLSAGWIRQGWGAAAPSHTRSKDFR